MPAPIDACRAGFCPCPAVRICPMITSDTSAPATPARLSASTIATLPRSWAGKPLSAPLNAPTGVRAAPTMTISFFISGSFDRTGCDQTRIDRTRINWTKSDRAGQDYICGSFCFPATPDVHAIWHLAYPWPAGGGRVNETKRRADLLNGGGRLLRWLVRMPNYEALG